MQIVKLAILAGLLAACIEPVPPYEPPEYPGYDINFFNETDRDLWITPQSEYMYTITENLDADSYQSIGYGFNRSGPPCQDGSWLHLAVYEGNPEFPGSQLWAQRSIWLSCAGAPAVSGVAQGGSDYVVAVFQNRTIEYWGPFHDIQEETWRDTEPFKCWLSDFNCP